MEKLLSYVWKHRIFPEKMKITDGSEIEILDPGLENTNAGPDFLNVKIKIGDIVWVGNVELHKNASDWEKHKHDHDHAYDTVILHVVEFMDRETVITASGEKIPHLKIEIPNKIRENYEYLISSDYQVACLPKAALLSPLFLSSWKDALLFERLELKYRKIEALLLQYNGSWEEVFYIILCRNFGFGLNSDSFEWLAKSLSYKIILKHCDSLTDIEALLFGQAGYLESNQDGEYAQYLRKQYDFFKYKYHLQPLTVELFKAFRIRPQSFPVIRLAQLAKLLFRSQKLFSIILETESVKELKKVFETGVSFFWRTHFSFSKQSSFSLKKIGNSSINIILINTIVPICFAYYQKMGNEKKRDAAIAILEQLPPESNYITRIFDAGNIPSVSAFDSQALIQLKKEYCDQKKCLQCRIAQKLLLQG